MNLLISLRSEILKSKRTASFYSTIIAAAVVPFILLLDITVDGVSPENGKTIFNSIFIEGFRMTSFAIFPMFVILIGTLLPQIEFRNNTWKQVFASPQTKENVYLAKYLNIHLLMLVFMVANHLFMFITAVVVHFLEPSLHVLNQPLDVYNILVNAANSYISVLALGTIQFWLGLRFKNFIVPVAIGLACWFTGSMMVMESKSSFAVYFPYSFHVYSSFDNHKSQLNQVQWTSLAYTILILFVGFIDFKRRKLHG
ncbi:MAG: ABC transporter permease [Flavisolibacter sp.]